jgi:hypothetical protein
MKAGREVEVGNEDCKVISNHETGRNKRALERK